MKALIDFLSRNIRHLPTGGAAAILLTYGPTLQASVAAAAAHLVGIGLSYLSDKFKAKL